MIIIFSSISDLFHSFFQFCPVSSSFVRTKLEKIGFFHFFQGVPEEIGFFRKKPNPGVNILGSMVSHQHVIVGLSQSVPAVGWGSPLHAWLASVNWIGSARCLNRRYRYGARGMHYHILLRQYHQNCYTYNSVVKNTCSPCHKDACIKISIGNTEWLLR